MRAGHIFQINPPYQMDQEMAIDEALNPLSRFSDDHIPTTNSSTSRDFQVSIFQPLIQAQAKIPTVISSDNRKAFKFLGRRPNTCFPSPDSFNEDTVILLILLMAMP
ncbi:hypothetical protein AMTR_s00003p00093520 [Amborella trichopoda]|uniref:Uncharacterized protein n=1 Tax=Amborella trichopoda TaxID=13333 RepID=W1P627_AMBTC|nr:hypothetical protein AMTR_s00003p00093520 [Amborella trichopoda]